MVLSRLLMRGFAESRAAWPMGFGLLRAGVQFVFDEVQGLREAFGTALPCRSMWMSATIDPAELSTVDLRRHLSVVDVADEGGELDLDADAKTYPAAPAQRAVAEHRPGTRTLVVLNTVKRATDVHAQLTKLAPAAHLVLPFDATEPDGQRLRRLRSSALLSRVPADKLWPYFGPIDTDDGIEVIDAEPAESVEFDPSPHHVGVTSGRRSSGTPPSPRPPRVPRPWTTPASHPAHCHHPRGIGTKTSKARRRNGTQVVQDGVRAGSMSAGSPSSASRIAASRSASETVVVHRVFHGVCHRDSRSNRLSLGVPNGGAAARPVPDETCAAGLVAPL